MPFLSEKSYRAMFANGIDISIQAATKYIVGHSDVMLGTTVAKAEYWDQLRKNGYLMGQCISPDDAYLGLGISPMDSLNKGDLCPACQQGKLYKYEPATLLRSTRQSPFVLE